MVPVHGVGQAADWRHTRGTQGIGGVTFGAQDRPAFHERVGVAGWILVLAEIVVQDKDVGFDFAGGGDRIGGSRVPGVPSLWQLSHLSSVDAGATTRLRASSVPVGAAETMMVASW